MSFAFFNLKNLNQVVILIDDPWKVKSAGEKLCNILSFFFKSEEHCKFNGEWRKENISCMIFIPKRLQLLQWMK